MLKFVVFKGSAGFGDRLQCLLQAIAYAKASGRYLVVDWRDEEWSRGEDDGFEAYFRLNGVKQFSLEAFLTWFEHNQDCGVVPKTWQSHMHRRDFRDLVYKPLFTGMQHGERFHKIANFEEHDLPDPVVVYCGTGYRGFRFTDFQHIELKPWVSQFIRQGSKASKLASGAYDVVHLRAGSKTWAGGHVPMVSLKEEIDRQFPEQAVYFQKVLENIPAEYRKPEGNPPSVVLCDNAKLAEQWIAYSGNGRFLSHSLDSIIERSGVHEIADDTLQQLGVSKYTANLECLRDFAVMLNARHVFWDQVSLFSKMASCLKDSFHESWRFQ